MPRSVCARIWEHTRKDGFIRRCYEYCLVCTARFCPVNTKNVMITIALLSFFVWRRMLRWKLELLLSLLAEQLSTHVKNIRLAQRLTNKLVARFRDVKMRTAGAVIKTLAEEFSFSQNSNVLVSLSLVSQPQSIHYLSAWRLPQQNTRWKFTKLTTLLTKMCEFRRKKMVY